MLSMLWQFLQFVGVEDRVKRGAAVVQSHLVKGMFDPAPGWHDSHNRAYVSSSVSGITLLVRESNPVPNLDQRTHDASPSRRSHGAYKAAPPSARCAIGRGLGGRGQDHFPRFRFVTAGLASATPSLASSASRLTPRAEARPVNGLIRGSALSPCSI